MLSPCRIASNRTSQHQKLINYKLELEKSLNQSPYSNQRKSTSTLDDDLIDTNDSSYVGKSFLHRLTDKEYTNYTSTPDIYDINLLSSPKELQNRLNNEKKLLRTQLSRPTIDDPKIYLSSKRYKKISETVLKRYKDLLKLVFDSIRTVKFETSIKDEVENPFENQENLEILPEKKIEPVKIAIQNKSCSDDPYTPLYENLYCICLLRVLHRVVHFKQRKDIRMALITTKNFTKQISMKDLLHELKEIKKDSQNPIEKPMNDTSSLSTYAFDNEKLLKRALNRISTHLSFILLKFINKWRLISNNGSD